jgi:uncharacterized protein (DUF1778 family)
MKAKEDYIRIRVTTEEKRKIKEVAKAKGKNMSELVLGSMERIIKKHNEMVESQKMIEDRARRADEKLAKITERIRGKKSKKTSLFNLGHSKNQ